MYETKEERDALFRFTGKYTETRLLNEEASGFGWAVLVQDNFEGKRPKVVKLPNREAATRELLAEAEILVKIAQYLRHPNLIGLGSVDRHVIEWQGKKEERWFIVLQFGGDSLRKRLGRLGLRERGGKHEYVYRGGAPLPVDDMLQIGIQAADGLRALHDFEEVPGQHIIHRDIKPENILIDADNVVRLADFGISKVVERITQSVTVMGTAPYLAPEYSRGRITAASDIYSLGIVLYEMATGRFPFTLQEDRFYQMPTPPHHLNPDVPPGLSDVIQRALWWDPRAAAGQEEAQRYSRSADLLKDLRRCFSRLHPVPTCYDRPTDKVHSPNVYRDKATGDLVRIFLCDTPDPAPCLSRLAQTLSLNDPGILAPRRTFESEGTVGIVVPLPPASAPRPGGALEAVQGRAVYSLVTHLIALCRQLEKLHLHGHYHGFLTPYHAYPETTHWVLDHVWLAALVGRTRGEEVLRTNEVAVGFLAPEVLRWESPPTLSSDLYGVGALLYGRLTCTPPMDPEAALAMTRGEPAPPFRAASSIRDRAPTVSRRLRNIVVKALQPDPVHRYHSLGELIRELSACNWPGDEVASLIEDARDLRAQGKLVETYDAFDQALRLDPGNPTVHHARAEVYFLEGEFKWALKENGKALDVEVTGSTCFLQGQCLQAVGQHDEAAAFYRRGLRLEDCSRGRHLLAQALEETGEHGTALAEYEQAVRLAQTVERNETFVQAIVKDRDQLLRRLGK